MLDNDFDLIIKALEFQVLQYRTSEFPCLALSIARNYRLLAELCSEEYEQFRYKDYANYWFKKYLNNPQHSIKKKKLLRNIMINHSLTQA